MIKQWTNKTDLWSNNKQIRQIYDQTINKLERFMIKQCAMRSFMVKLKRILIMHLYAIAMEWVIIVRIVLF